MHDLIEVEMNRLEFDVNNTKDFEYDGVTFRVAIQSRFLKGYKEPSEVYEKSVDTGEEFSYNVILNTIQDGQPKPVTTWTDLTLKTLVDFMEFSHHYQIRSSNGWKWTKYAEDINFTRALETALKDLINSQSEFSYVLDVLDTWEHTKGTCPYCGTKHLMYMGEANFDDDCEIRQPMKCHACANNFDEVYRADFWRNS